MHLTDYDRAWPDLFADQQARVAAVLAPWLAAPVEHIGSTSVPGLAAKPVIDMLAPVRSLTGAQDAVAPLTEDGWLFWPDDPCRHYRLWFLRPRPEARTHHLQLIGYDEPHARANRNAYTNAKSEFVARVLHAADIDPPPRDDLPE